ncbi:hypothetical protein [Nonomuraea candida]|uniref:hypothetical protein n=1 Tax=Nonomuraea candida TaxID=359159 RepID=UPI0005BBDABF|nr:hypothetical protein [Nonomuraea candida]
MAPTPAGAQSAKAVPGVVAELADCLGGTVHLAYAQASGLDVVVAGFSRYEAQTRARAIARATALDRLHRLAGDARSRTGVPRGRELRLADFLTDPPEAAGPLVPGTGLVSGNRYRLPAEVVWLGGRETLVEPTTTGVVDVGIAESIAEVIAHDVVSRWWAAPSGQPLLRVSAQLDQLLPAGVTAAAAGLGLRLSAFVLSVPDVRIGLVTVGGEGATLGVAAGRTVRSAIGEAFLRAMAAKAQPWATLALPEALRRFAVWHREGDYVAHLERRGVDAEPWLIGEPGDLRPASWQEIAARRFGHEPVAVEYGGAGLVVKVVCPGASCYRAAPSGLPCPIP